MKNMKDLFEESKISLDISKLPIRASLDIPYCDDDNPAHVMDIALPESGKGPFPVVVFLHGGGFYHGFKRNIHTAQAWNTIPAAGLALATINYRLTPKAAWPAQIYDCKAAIRFLRAHAKEFDIDAEHIGVWGNSAGGLLAAILASTGENKTYEDLSMGCSEQSSAIQAACVWYGIYDIPNIGNHWRRILKAGDAPIHGDYDVMGALLNNPEYDCASLAVFASATYHVHPDMPPMLLFHGTNDHIVPYLQTSEFYERYLQMNDHSKIHLSLLENAQHGGPSFSSPENLLMIKSFFKKWLA